MLSSQVEMKLGENAKNIDVLSKQSEACIRRLQNLEHEVMIYDAQGLESQSRGTSILSANTAASAQSTWDSIFDAYGWIPFANDKSYNNEDGHVAARGIQKQYEQIAELADDFLLQDLDRLSGEDEGGNSCILSFDNGRMRTYSSLLIHRELMSKISDSEDSESIFTESTPAILDQQKGRRSWPRLNSRLLPCHYFDYILGSSTDGIVAIMLTRLRMSIEDCIAEYKVLLFEMFRHPRPSLGRGVFSKRQPKYGHEPFHKALQPIEVRYTSLNKEKRGNGPEMDLIRCK